ncbi:1-(5-phosphoribosyl)-5-[(5-phosphoribosylamino) methylideneamino] imidazole-4-carboxamide isomerase [Methanobrevibacter arboriphilus]|jgi:phosphoribosylformimino-5-aminoimidazole carboxamide ribotide isomerase|uniref:1-(5-phosphoribosyl)-5-[(5-phosphoribosylamino) methylideneamino] imidazole-4-carboxamide isomerase n=1 Tax=Methanobrevibacter arboriphilus TaxID=39441 RepID=A0ACA8R626_METAZ|nr:1-(5-phosphoribosyl)-5-[(5-phosphoribosylamino)methylideneamino]imidazole-4-carboxamide isomerase [Methanobrevibacter arboriphilus]BBL62822.1 1-(5-phosphoribosyl)-5-[(5-phosphoribosylamino) methylideneamino] imidazole-4-carboxamide isomerase [Methanobrevibacter arboriphilus]GLI12064.1 1-(5-phosphoribosyl)-5-[(5-phosphoribosylamino) methylideneamino] imidazole-4-carboxamide isomerase [Methanobrevibacter arboriphilus]
MSFKEEKMLIMPAVDIKNGKCVQLVQGKPGTEQVIIDNPEKVAKKWEDEGAEIIHVIDLDGALETKDNLNTIEKILKEVNVPIQLGGGIRSIEYAEKLLNLDIERLIIGTMAIEKPNTIKKLSEEFGSERIMVSLDSKDSKVVIKGWKEKIDKKATDISREFQEAGAGSILFTNVDVEGLLSGLDIQPAIDLVNSVDIPIVYSGGITTLEDLKKLTTTGVKGVVIGSALYKNKINLIDALKLQSK